MPISRHTAYSAISTALGTELNSLANSGNSAASATIDNSGTRALYADFELVLAAQGVARSAGATVSLYLLTSLDGTNFDDAHEVTAEPAAVWALDAATNARRRTVRDVPIPPAPFRVFVRNSTGQAFAASGNTIRYRTHSVDVV